MAAGDEQEGGEENVALRLSLPRSPGPRRSAGKIAGRAAARSGSRTRGGPRRRPRETSVMEKTDAPRRGGFNWGGIVAGGRCAPGASRRRASRSRLLCKAPERARNRVFGVEADAPVSSPVPSLITANSFPDNRELFPCYFPCTTRAKLSLKN